MTVTMEADETPRNKCCAGWAKLSPARQAEWRWQAAHELCHSRVPFSLAKYAEVANVTVRAGRRLLSDAYEMGWWTPQNGLHVGSLPRKR